MRTCGCDDVLRHTHTGVNDPQWYACAGRTKTTPQTKLSSVVAGVCARNALQVTAASSDPSHLLCNIVRGCRQLCALRSWRWHHRWRGRRYSRCSPCRGHDRCCRTEQSTSCHRCCYAAARCIRCYKWHMCHRHRGRQLQRGNHWACLQESSTS